MDLQSILGYQRGSPFAGNSYLDINSNIIDMSNTPIDLIGVDNKGNKKKMKAGRRNPYIFEGDTVREIPTRQVGGLYSTNKPAFVDSVMGANQNLNFVQRYLHPNNYPVINNPDGSYSTHLMASSDNFSYPTVIQDSTGKLVKMDPRDAYNYAMKNKQYIQFPSEDQANWFSANGYKQGKQYQKGGYAAMDFYKSLFQDSPEDYDEEDKNLPTAPSEQDLPQDEQQPLEDEDVNLAIQMAIHQDEYNVTGRNPYGSVTQPSSGNPYSSAGTVSNPAKYAFEFFQQKGLPAHVAAGIVGNLIQESGNFRPDVVTDEITGDNGASHGIAQWQGSRWPAFKNWAASQQADPHNLDTQLEYVYQEARQRGDLQKTLTAKTSSEAANIFAKNYERPVHLDAHRAKYARGLYPD